MQQICLPRFGSNHMQIKLESGKHCFRPQHFIFELAWLAYEGFNELIRGWWEEIQPVGCGAFVIAKRFAWLKKKLRWWTCHTFGAIHNCKLKLLHSIKALDIIRETCSFNMDEQNRETKLKRNLSVTILQEEVYWRQRSRVTWLKSGDVNTKFFHNMTNDRRNRNSIQQISHEDTMLIGDENIGNNFTSSFRSQFGSKHSHHFHFYWLRFLA